MKEDLNKIDDNRFQQIKADFVRKAINSYPKTESNTINYSARNTAQSNYNKANTKQNEQNALRNTVDGALAGNQQYMNSLLNKKIEENGVYDRFVRGVDYSNGVLQLTIEENLPQSKEEREQGIKPPTRTYYEEINSSDPEASTKMVRLLRPNDDPDKVLEEYKKGNPTNFEKNTYKGETKTSLRKKSANFKDSLPEIMKSDTMVEALNSNNLKGFKEANTYPWSNNVVGPNGIKYNVDTKEGMTAFKKYITSKEYLDTLKKQDAPEPDNIPEEKATSLRNKYGY